MNSSTYKITKESKKIPSKKLGDHFSIANYICDCTILDDKTELCCKIIDILNMMSEGKDLPTLIEYNDMVYKNTSRDHKNMMYISVVDKNDIRQVLFFTPELFDVDILNQQIKIIEM